MTFRTDFYGRKDKTPTFTDNRKRGIAEERVVLVEEPNQNILVTYTSGSFSSILEAMIQFLKTFYCTGRSVGHRL